MNFCSKCGNKLNDENKCTNCDGSVKSRNEEKSNKRRIITSKIFAWISFILAIVPFLVLLYCIIDLLIPSDEGEYSWVLIFLYFLYANLPVAIGSLVSGLVSNKINKNKLALYSFYVNILPLCGSIFNIIIIISRLINS